MNQKHASGVSLEFFEYSWGLNREMMHPHRYMPWQGCGDEGRMKWVKNPNFIPFTGSSQNACILE